MTDTEVSPTVQENHIIAAIPLRVTVHPTVIAQRAGDAAYEAVIEHGGGGEEAAVAYHVACQRIAKVNGAGPWCECELCCPVDPEPGVENPANHAADLKGW